MTPGLRKPRWERSGWRVVRDGVVVVARPHRHPGVAGVGDLAEGGRLRQPRSVLRLTKWEVTAFSLNISPGGTTQQLGVITLQTGLVLVLVVVVSLLSLASLGEDGPAVEVAGPRLVTLQLSSLLLLLLHLLPRLVRPVYVGLQALLSRILALLLRLPQVGLTVWPRPAVFTGSFLLNSGGFIVCLEKTKDKHLFCFCFSLFWTRVTRVLLPGTVSSLSLHQPPCLSLGVNSLINIPQGSLSDVQPVKLLNHSGC